MQTRGDVTLNLKKPRIPQRIPTKGVMRFEKKNKLNLRLIGPFEILKQVGGFAYELALPPDLLYVHCAFCVSML